MIRWYMAAARFPFVSTPRRWLVYPPCPADRRSYSERMDRIYSRFAATYDAFIRVFPPWNRWIRSVLPHVRGPRVLDVGFGPASLFLSYPSEIELHGVDFNRRMVNRARRKMATAGRRTDLVVGSVENLPYPDAYFQTVVSTMAFSGFPDGTRAFSEMSRVLAPGGTLLIVDFDYPDDRNILGLLLVRLMIISGDTVRNLAELASSTQCHSQHEVVGGFGSVHMYVFRSDPGKV